MPEERLILDEILVHVGETRKAIAVLESSVTELRDWYKHGVQKEECEKHTQALNASIAQLQTSVTSKKHGLKRIGGIGGLIGLLTFLGSVCLFLLQTGRKWERVEHVLELATKQQATISRYEEKERQALKIKATKNVELLAPAAPNNLLR